MTAGHPIDLSDSGWMTEASDELQINVSSEGHEGSLQDSLSSKPVSVLRLLMKELKILNVKLKAAFLIFSLRSR